MEHDSTTQIIKRRIRHLKTTTCGIIAFAAPLAMVIWPKHAIIFSGLLSVATGAGLISAADAKPQKE
jgi:hypothetical protein